MPTSALKITNDTRDKNNWVEGTYKGHFFQAKVYDSPSEYGIDVKDGQSRTSKLAVNKGAKWNHETVIFNYDRGMDVDHPMGLEIAKLLEVL